MFKLLERAGSPAPGTCYRMKIILLVLEHHRNIDFWWCCIWRTEGLNFSQLFYSSVNLARTRVL